MIVSCTSCGAKYRYDETRFEGRPSKKIRCTKCETVFDVMNPSAPEPAPLRSVAINPPALASDMTYTRSPSGDSPAPAEKTREHAVRKVRTSPHPTNLRLPPDKKLALAAISGSDSGKTFPIEKPRVVIGRTGADISLSDAEISRNHAAIEVQDDEVTLLDLGSTNGTYVGGERIESMPLENYGEFEVGSTTLMLIVTNLS